MDVFTTREIAVFIYAIILLLYFLSNKKIRLSLLQVIKAALKIKIIIPFFIMQFFVVAFIWLCTFLPFWDWLYIKDIIIWFLFAGVPTCFNAANRNLEKHYFRNIVIDNFKFSALVEFITGTFTFHIVLELFLQPFLLFLFILQSQAKGKSESVKKIIDFIIGIVGISIIAITIKSAIDATEKIVFLDIIVSFMIPIVLSILYLPIAYLLAVYSKYEILFLRMRHKEPIGRKQRIKRRIKIIKLCKLSYKKVCEFLYGYMPKMYINMGDDYFEELLNEFQSENYRK